MSSVKSELSPSRSPDISLPDFYDEENSPRAGNLNNVENLALAYVSYDGTQSPSQEETSRSGRSSKGSKKRACTFRDMFGRCGRFASSPYIAGAELCARHGGGYRCAVAGCRNHGIDNLKRCRAHGGGKRCTIPGCDKSAQNGLGGGLFCRAHFLAQDSSEQQNHNPAIE